MKNKKKFCKIFIFIFSIFFLIPIYADNLHWQQIIDKWKIDYLSYNIVYGDFLESLKSIDENVSKYTDNIRVTLGNKKLIIGDSAAVYCLKTMGEDLDNMGFDIISCGSVTEDQMTDWISSINKKYDKIILLGGVNTINLEALNNWKTVEPEMLLSVAKFFVAMQNYILNNDGKMFFVKIKEKVYPRDDENLDFCNRFNTLANQRNVWLETVCNIPSLEIKYDATIDNAESYSHYTNKQVFYDLLDGI